MDTVNRSSYENYKSQMYYELVKAFPKVMDKIGADLPYRFSVKRLAETVMYTDYETHLFSIEFAKTGDNERSINKSMEQLAAIKAHMYRNRDLEHMWLL